MSRRWFHSGVLSRSNTGVESCAGRDAHATPLMGAEHALEDISHRHAPSQFVLGALKESRAAKQLGTLGGGNHFLEVATPLPAALALSGMHTHVERGTNIVDCFPIGAVCTCTTDRHVIFIHKNPYCEEQTMRLGLSASAKPITSPKKHAQQFWGRLHPEASFCSLQLVYDETGRVWIMLHSGSRNIGNKTAQHYDDIAAKELKRQGTIVSQRLHYMEVDSAEGQSYLQVR